MKKLLYGVVFASPADKEYGRMAHVWMRDAETAYWFSLSRGLNSDVIEVMASDQRSQTSDGLDVILYPTGILVKVNQNLARSLDGHLEYAIEFHPESQDFGSIRETLEVIFRGKSELLMGT